MDHYADSAKALKSALQNEYGKIVASNHVLAENTRMMKLRAIQAGWILLAAVDELHCFYDNGSADPRLIKIMEATRVSLLTPCQLTVSALSNQVATLKQCMNASKKTNRFFAGIDIAAGALSTTVSLVGLSYGFAILLGFSGLALGPFGALALGVGILFISSLMASSALEDICLNTRFCNDMQLDEIEAYATTLESEWSPSAQKPAVQPIENIPPVYPALYSR